MSRFREMPVVVEAVQWYPGVPVEGADEFEEWSGNGIRLLLIQTNAGRRAALAGDWIVTDANGERHPCTPEAFEQTYKPVGED